MNVRAAFDPTHLVALDALLAERSVTRAAARLGITQSSMSHRLAVLRRSLGDPLFVRQGTALVPTPRAIALTHPLGEALRALAAAVEPPAPFVPATAKLAIQIALPDLLAPVAPRLVRSLLEAAPLADIRLLGIAPDLGRVLAGEVPSMALTPARFVDADTRSQMLGDLTFGVAGRADHPALRRPLTVARWLAHPHVVVRVGNERTNLVQEELDRRGLVRRVGLVVPSFLAGLLIVARSDFLINVPLPLVDEAAEQLGLRVRAAPVPLPRLRFALAWHPRFQDDAGHRWSRDRVLATVRPLFAATKRGGRGQAGTDPLEVRSGSRRSV